MAEETRPLRHLVLWPHILRTEDCIIDIDLEPHAMHFGILENGTLVGVCSLFAQTSPRIIESRQVRLRAMATHPDVRGKGFGKRLLEFAINTAREVGYEVIWCDARLNAVGFYTGLGFELLDEIYEVPKIGPHKFMWKALKSK